MGLPFTLKKVSFGWQGPGGKQPGTSIVLKVIETHLQLFALFLAISGLRFQWGCPFGKVCQARGRPGRGRTSRARMAVRPPGWSCRSFGPRKGSNGRQKTTGVVQVGVVWCLLVLFLNFF